MFGPKVMPNAQKELDHFFNILWCRDQFLHPDAVAVPRLDDKQDGRGGTGKLFSETLNSPSTIYHRIVLYHDPLFATSLNPKLKKRWLPVETCSVFYALGDGVCGFGGICHGGVQATFLDDFMGVCGILNARLQHRVASTEVPGKCSPEANHGMFNLVTNMVATQGIEIQYLWPLRVPKVIQITASMVEISHDERKFIPHSCSYQRWEWKGICKSKGALGSVSLEGKTVARKAGD